MGRRFPMREPQKRKKLALGERIDITDLSPEEFARGWGRFEGKIEIINGRKFLVLKGATHRQSKKLIGHKGTGGYI